MDFLLHFGPSHYNDLFRCEHPYFASEGKGDVSKFVAKYLENYEKAGENGLICINIFFNSFLSLLYNYIDFLCLRFLQK